MEQKRMSELHRINKAVLLQYAILTVILFAAYVLEFVKGSRTIEYTLVFILIDVLPFTMYAVSYKKNPESTILKYIFSIGFSVLYAFVLLTAAVPTTFVYIFMIYVAIIPYGDIRLCYITGGIAVLANIVSVAYGFVTGALTTADLAMVEIQFAAILIGAIFVGLATHVTGKVNAQKLQEINEEKDKTERILSNTLQISQGISSDIEAVTERMKVLRRFASSTHESMQDVTAGANETAESMQQQLSQTEEIVEQIDSAKDVADSISKNVLRTEETISIGKSNIDQLLNSVNQSEILGSAVGEKMNELVENTKKMNSIVEMINSIASQTSLLSLNASIEAARAGEAGRGFAIVASEISSLANQTSDATINITKLIGDLNTAIEDGFKSTNQMMENNTLQNQAVETMATTFEEIKICVRNIQEVSTNLEVVIRELAHSNETIVNGINMVSSVTQEVSARANETLENSENNSQLVREVTETVYSINEKAKQLNE